MDDLSLTEVRRLVDAANALRWQSDASGSAAGSDGRRAERRLDALFGSSHTLVVYGTLGSAQPSRPRAIWGEWTDGLIEGDPLPLGWGADLGYPGYRPRVGGAAVAVQVLSAPLLTSCRCSAQSLAVGRPASGGCTRSPTSMPRSSVSVAKARLRRCVSRPDPIHPTS